MWTGAPHLGNFKRILMVPFITLHSFVYFTKEAPLKCNMTMTMMSFSGPRVGVANVMKRNVSLTSVDSSCDETSEVQVLVVPSPFAARCYLCSSWMPARTRVAYWHSDEMMACITCYMEFCGWLETRLNLGHLLQRWHHHHRKMLHQARANRVLVHVKLWQQGDWQVWVQDFRIRWVVAHAIRAWHDEVAPFMPELASSSSSDDFADSSSSDDFSEHNWAWPLSH